MAAKLIVFFALLALATAGLVRRDAPDSAVQQNWDSLLQQLSNLSNTLKSTIDEASGKAKDSLQNINNQINDFHKAHPEVKQQADALGDKIKALGQSVAKETEKIVKDVQQKAQTSGQELAPKAKEAFDTLLKHTEEIHKKLSEGIKQ